MFASVLIANRGEIACRVIRTAKRLGLRAIAVYSDADAGALHTRLADEAYPIGPPPAADSYLRIDRLIETAKRAGAACIHPGYGFLAERDDFAEACEKADIVFIGPSPAAIRAMGLKDVAKARMAKAGVPVVPGYHGERQEPAFLKQKAYEIGYPVLIKAVAGGGGKGMRKVDKHAGFDEALAGAMREARSAFGDARVLIEKYVAAPRHIEMQIFGDRHGNLIHLNERDCSLQRRHQKVIEEAPAPGMSADMRSKMGAAAVEAARAVGYVGAGTIEFIADASDGLRADRFWFMEMNTRLQVEHPVTEAVTGLDLVEWQFRVAAGEPLALKQDQVPLNGHAVEARLYAEDPDHGFLPSTGRLVALEWPKGDAIRIDSGVEPGGEVSPYYDPMIAKIIARAPSRAEALDRLARALDDTLVAGPRTNVGFLANLCRAEAFRAGKFDTGFIDRHLSDLGVGLHGIDRAAAAAGAALLVAKDEARIAARAQALSEETASPWATSDAFQLTGGRGRLVPIVVDGQPSQARVGHGDGMPVTVDGASAAEDAKVVEAGEAAYVLRHGRQTVVRLKDFSAIDLDHLGGDGVVRAPMHGKVLSLLVAAGGDVHKGQPLAIVEAMKMEHTLTAPIAGKVGEISVSVGTQVEEGAVILVVEVDKKGAPP